MKRLLWLIGASASLTALACGTDSPTTGVSLTAPGIQSPVPGERITENPPTLTVTNAQGGEGEPTYAFQVAGDEGFINIVATVEGVGQGSGSTSWRVPVRLEGGQAGGDGTSVFFWRARASATTELGPWSPTASFSVDTGFFRPQGELVIYDPLVDGGSVGTVSGGVFEPRGWRTTDAGSFIRYHVPTLQSGFVEFDVTNLREPNPHSDKRMLMIMWDPRRGGYTQNPFRVHLQKLDTRTVDFGHVRLRWISGGQERNIYHDHTNWSPDRIYNFRMEWGNFPRIDTQWIRVLLDGEEILTANYDNLYLPTAHWIELGGAPRNETLEQAVFSNVRIGRR